EAPAGYYLAANYSGTALTLTVTATATITWTGGGGTSNWTTATNWDLGRVPAVGDDVVITAGSPITVNGTVEINTLASARRIDFTGGTLTIQNGAAFNGGLNAT